MRIFTEKCSSQRATFFFKKKFLYKMNHFTEIFIEYAHIWGFLFCFFASMLHRMRDLSSLEIKPITPEVDTQSPKQ